MHVGITFANTGPGETSEGARSLAIAAEEAGIESLWTVEHIVVPKGYESTYPYSKDGRMPGEESIGFPDPFVWLAFVAGATKRIRLATGITIVPMRHPLALAKTAASLDVLSGGRMILGVGVGWLEEEFTAFDVPFERRGARTDEYVAAVRDAWSGDVTSIDGDFVSYGDVYVRPRPATGTIPIVVGGHSEAAARRAGRLGDGFFPAGAGRDRVIELWDIARRTAEESGRDPEAIELTVGGRPDLETIGWWAERGAHRLLFAAGSVRDVELVGEHVIPHL